MEVKIKRTIGLIMSFCPLSYIEFWYLKCVNYTKTLFWDKREKQNFWSNKYNVKCLGIQSVNLNLGCWSHLLMSLKGSSQVSSSKVLKLFRISASGFLFYSICPLMLCKIVCCLDDFSSMLNSKLEYFAWFRMKMWAITR